MILCVPTTTTSTRYGNKKIVSKGETDWWKQDERTSERGSEEEVVTPIVKPVVLRVNVLGKQVHCHLADLMKLMPNIFLQVDTGNIMIDGHEQTMTFQMELKPLVLSQPTILHRSR
jgi:hypothetical protein